MARPEGFEPPTNGSVYGQDEKQVGLVLEHLNRLQSASEVEAKAKKERALATLAKYRGCFKAEPFNREKIHDRQDLRVSVTTDQR